MSGFKVERKTKKTSETQVKISERVLLYILVGACVGTLLTAAVLIGVVTAVLAKML